MSLLVCHLLRQINQAVIDELTKIEVLAYIFNDEIDMATGIFKRLPYETFFIALISSYRDKQFSSFYQKVQSISESKPYLDPLIQSGIETVQNRNFELIERTCKSISDAIVMRFVGVSTIEACIEGSTSTIFVCL